MGQTTIEWCGTILPDGKLHRGWTFNPWWGCTKVSPGCKHCYAEQISDVRMQNSCWGPGSERKKFGNQHWKKPLAWNSHAKKLGVKLKVFCASMADVFEDHPAVIWERQSLFLLIESTPWLHWLLLTKRIDNVMKMVPPGWRDCLPENVWIGTSIENQECYYDRIQDLMDIPVWTRFVSLEPLLGPINLHLSQLVKPKWSESMMPVGGLLSWVIVGGESGGKKSRPLHPYWVMNLQSQCADKQVPFFFKQWGDYYTHYQLMTDEEPVFKMYDSFEQFKNKLWVKPDDKCIDLNGKACLIGKDFETANYPVAIMNYTGKKKAGRILAGKTYSETPVRY